MKNLFSYATKEFVQNSFLRWLIENYNCEDDKVSFYARKFLSAFMGLSYPLEANCLSDMQSWAEWKHIDVSFWFCYKGKKIAVFIEDKTTAEEHNQLDKYNVIIEDYCNLNDIEYYRIFYKSSILDKDEYDRVLQSGWEIFDAKRILELFDDCDCEFLTNNILKDYVLNIRQFKDYMLIPFNQWNKQTYLFYFKDVLCPVIDEIQLTNQLELKAYSGIWQGRSIWWVVQSIGNPSYELKFEFNSHSGHQYNVTAILRFLDKEAIVSNEFIDSVNHTEWFRYRRKKKNANQFAVVEPLLYDRINTQNPTAFAENLRLIVQDMLLIHNKV